MSYPVVYQGPAATLNYSHSWTDWLAQGDTIASRQWTITPLNGTEPETPTLTGDTTDTVFVSDLELGRLYYLREHVVTAAGLEDDRTIVLVCQQN